jgi:hypothetical protein
MFRVTATSPVAHVDPAGQVAHAADEGRLPGDLVNLVQRSWDHATAACRAAEDLLDTARERNDRDVVVRLVGVLDACVRGQAALDSGLRALRDGGPVGPAEVTPWTYGAAPLLADGPRGRE